MMSYPGTIGVLYMKYHMLPGIVHNKLRSSYRITDLIVVKDLFIYHEINAFMQLYSRV
jgi:hypothetical protein